MGEGEREGAATTTASGCIFFSSAFRPNEGMCSCRLTAIRVCLEDSTCKDSVRSGLGGREEGEVVQGLGVGVRVVLINTEVICIKQKAWLCNEHTHPAGVSERKSQSQCNKRANT